MRILLFVCVGVSFLTLMAYETIAPGVRYMHIKLDVPDVQSIYMVSIDVRKVQFHIGLAHDMCASAETTSAMAQRTGAIAAINGGFFDFGCQTRMQYFFTVLFDMLGYSRYNAYPVYGLKKDGQWISISHVHTGVCGWSKRTGSVVFDTIKTDCTISIGNSTYQVDELNMPCRSNIVMYTPAYGPKTPKKGRKVAEIVVQKDKVSAVLPRSKGNTPIPADGFVCVINNKKPAFELPHEDDHVSIQFSSTRLDGTDTTDAWNAQDFLLASTPLLLKDGEIISTLASKTSGFYTERHPRTALGVLDSGMLVLVVVDGRSKNAQGFSILELANFMKQLGCCHALNLDGGGSSTMVLNGAVINKPSGREYGLVKKERPISTALLVMPPA